MKLFIKVSGLFVIKVKEIEGVFVMESVILLWLVLFLKSKLRVECKVLVED